MSATTSIIGADFFNTIEDIEKEKGIPRQYMYDKIRQAMMAAFRKDNPEAADNVVIDMSEESALRTNAAADPNEQ